MLQDSAERLAGIQFPPYRNDELLIYLDPGFSSDWGHYASYATAIHPEAHKRKVDLWHLTTADVSDDSAAKFSLLKAFDCRPMPGADDALFQKGGEIAGSSVTHFLERGLLERQPAQVLGSFLATVRALLDKLAAEHRYERIKIYMYTCHPLHVALMAELLAHPSYASLQIATHLNLFYLNPCLCTDKKPEQYEKLLALVSRSLELHDPGAKITLYLDSQRSIERYQNHFARKLVLSPLPLAGQKRKKSLVSNPPGSITIGFFGFAHEKQGYPLFKELYDRISRDEKYRHVHFVVRHNKKYSPQAIREMASSFQGEQERIVHLPGNFLQELIYDEYVARCDIIAIPHSREYYPCQTSGLCTDALTRGKMIVVPDDTWMSDQLQNFGSGEVFRSGDADDFVEVTRKILDNFEEYSAPSDRDPERFSRFHSAKTLFNMMEVGYGVPETDLLKLKDRHKGKRCFVVGNGPSLNQMDLNKLEGEYVFCTNAFFLMFPRISWRPQYFTCVDTRVLPDRAEGIIKMHEENPDMVLLFPQRVLNHETKEVARAIDIIPPAKNRFYFNQVVPNQNDLPFSAFSIEAHNHVVQPYTVTVTALQLAVHLGFDEIYLIGCDTNYVVPDTVLKEGNDPKLGKFLFTSTKDDDPNHFCPEYFGQGRKWHNPQVHNMIWHYEMAHEATALYGRHVYNATVGGKLEVFPRVDFEELF